MHCFISYSNKDHTIARTICRHLEARGVSCWIAPRDIPPGSTYSEEIINGIQRADSLVLILSDNSNLSRHVLAEVERAFSLSKPVFPVRIRDVQPSRGLELFVAGSQWIDALALPLESKMDELAGAILRMCSVNRTSASGGREYGVACEDTEYGSDKISTNIDESIGEIDSKKTRSGAKSTAKLPQIEIDEGFEITRICCVPASNMILVANASGKVALCNLETYRKEVEFQLHDDSVSGLFALDAAQFITSGRDGAIRYWKISEEGPKRRVRLIDEYIYTREDDFDIEIRNFAIAKERKLVAIARGPILDNTNCQGYGGGLDNVDLLNLGDFSFVYSFKFDNFDIRSCCFGYDEKYLVALCQCEDQVNVVDLDTYEAVSKTYCSEYDYVYDIAASSKNNNFIIRGSRNVVCMYTIPKAKESNCYLSEIDSESSGHYVDTNCVAYHPSRPFIAAGYGGPGFKRGVFCVWKISQNRPLHKINVGNYPISAIAFSNNGLVVMGDVDGFIHMWRWS